MFCSKSPASDVMELKELGIVPDKELELRSKYSRPFIDPKVVGMGPVRELLLQVSILNPVKLLVELGMVPTKEFLSK